MTKHDDDDHDDGGHALATQSQSQLLLLELVDALRDVAKAELSKGPGIAVNAWRQLYNVAADIIGDDQLARAVPVPGRPVMVVPPARRGAVQAPYPPPMAMPPGPRVPIPVGATSRPIKPSDIRSRPDVAAELERVKAGKPK